MAEQYPDRARVYKGNRAAKNIRLKKRNTGKKIVIAALLIFIAAIITILIVLQNDKTAEKLIGIWRYDEYTPVSYTHLDVYKRQERMCHMTIFLI